MSNRRISTKKSITQLSNTSLQNCKNFSTPGETIQWLVDDRLPFIRRNITPRAYVASRLGISESELSLMISNQRPIKLTQFCTIASIAKAPEAFQFLAEYTFPDDLERI